MICTLCNFEFKEEIIDKSCAMCVMNNHCRFVKCPNCGYEIPAESNLIKKFKGLKINWRKEKNVERR